ncbi:MAG TPA: HutD family protein [Roseomonas sp.]|jgi:environmental stress-induced protein Ves
MGTLPTIIRAASLQPRPWPNGLGITRDVAVQDQTETGFGWLISIADLTGEAAFSHFPSIDRVFTLIEGPGATLTLDGRFPLPCHPWVPACFPGDRPTHYRPGGGPARAFNVFTDRDAFEARVSVRSIAASHRVPGAAASVAVFCARGMLEIGGERLEGGDTMLHPAEAPIEAVGAAAIAIIVEVMPGQASQE